MKKFWLNCFLATVFVFGLMWALLKITDLRIFNAFDPIGQALNDFELTDYAFSNLRDDPVVEQRIVLVNIGTLPRAGIAEQIRIISKYKPKVIGVDSYFNCEGDLRDSVNCPQLLDTMGNLLLANAIQEAGNVVLVSKFHQSLASVKTGAFDVYDSMEYSDSVFQHFAQSGFANLVTANKATYQEDVKICRSFVPRMTIAGKEQLAFAVKMAMVFDSLKTMEFLKRNKEEELINYTGNVEGQDLKSRALRTQDHNTTNFAMMFNFIDVHQVLNEDFDSLMIKNNIVIFGFLGEYFGDPAWNDKFFTPLNKKVAGRANPDMFGVVIHANIVSMILSGDFIDELEEWHKYVIAFLFCFLNMALFFYINQRSPVWFDSLSLIIQVTQIVLLMGFTIWIFSESYFKLDLTITLAAIALAGPVFSFYDNIVTSLVRIWKNKRLTKRPEEVLTAQNQDIS